jgi:hypothetical protein
VCFVRDTDGDRDWINEGYYFIESYIELYRRILYSRDTKLVFMSVYYFIESYTELFRRILYNIV